MVGGQAVSLRPADPDRIGAAAAVMERVAGRAPEHARQTLSVPVEGETAAWEIASGLRREGVAVTEFSLHLPSLDEVFFALTGTARGTEGEPST